MNRRPLIEGLLSRGVGAVLAAAALFGASTPLAKQLLGSVSPWLLAGLLYLGSGIALTSVRLFRPIAKPRMSTSERGYLTVVVLIGGVAAPILLMNGLASMPAAGVSLLLNAEGVFTALIAWIVFRENVDWRIALGMLAIAAGAVILSWAPHVRFDELHSTLLVLAACLAWAIDNNLTRKLSLLDPIWLASIKGLGAGSINLLIAITLGGQGPDVQQVLAGLVVGALSYGTSLSLFIYGLRHLGAARTTAYFSLAPFVGASIALLWLHEPLTLQLILAGFLMALGMWLHLTERHDHLHHHPALEHSHEHTHDEHHRHAHDPEVSPGTKHTHWHRHEPLTHSHHHFPDAHHQHEHG